MQAVQIVLIHWVEYQRVSRFTEDDQKLKEEQKVFLHINLLKSVSTHKLSQHDMKPVKVTFCLQWVSASHSMRNTFAGFLLFSTALLLFLMSLSFVVV